MLTSELISTLWCPTCTNGALRPDDELDADHHFDQGELICETCDSSYPVRNGIPALLPHGSLTTDEWELWRKHLEKFQARRQDRIQHPDRKVTRWAKPSKPQRPFASFTGIAEGKVLDIGCGPGKFRFNFDDEKVHYVGLDPITLDGVDGFPFVRGLAEYIPFQDNTFTDVVVLAALDHFRDRDKFFCEASRVLIPQGKLHILQSVHEIRGIISAVKVVAHELKDAIEDRVTEDKGQDVPKHLAEFTKTSLLDLAQRYFDVVATENYSARWYSPEKMFLSLAPKKRVADDEGYAKQTEASSSDQL